MCDADGQQPATLIETIKKRLAGPYGFPVIPIIVVQMLEAWLVADPVALERVVGIKSSFRNPERVRNPKSELQRLLSRRTAYTPEVARRLAEQVDLQLLERRCRQFSAFRKALVDPWGASSRIPDCQHSAARKKVSDGISNFVIGDGRITIFYSSARYQVAILLLSKAAWLRR
jgi:hypothetical protein